MFNLAPLYLGAATEKFALGHRQIGTLSGVEIAGIALTSLLALWLLPRWGCRRVAALGLLGIAVGNLASSLASDWSQLLLLRFLTGLLGDGPAYASAVVSLGMHRNPTRAFAVFSFANMLFAAISLALLSYAMEGRGWPVVPIFLATFTFLAATAVPGLPGPIRQRTRSLPGSLVTSAPAVPALVGILAFTLNLGAVWSFAERIGVGAGLGQDTLGKFLGLSILFQAAGYLTAAILSARFRRLLPMTAVLLAQTVGLYLLARPDSIPVFFTGIALWGFGWNLGIAYQLGQMARLPHGNRWLALAPGTEAVGAACGAPLAGLLVATCGFGPMLVTAGIAALVSIAIFLRISERSDSTSEPSLHR